VADKLLDIALSHIPAESGTFYLADVNGHELTFAAVRGPKADALKRSGMTVKVGQGIIGFCAQEGVCLAVSDIQNDPRFFAALAKSIDYQPKDTLCASAEKDGRLWGALQIINSKSGFDAAHMEVLRFIGLTAAAMLERAADRE
jgi:GAF domain-containing protein